MRKKRQSKIEREITEETLLKNVRAGRDALSQAERKHAIALGELLSAERSFATARQDFFQYFGYFP